MSKATKQVKSENVELEKKKLHKPIDPKIFVKKTLTEEETTVQCPIPISELDEHGLPLPKWYLITPELATALLTLNYQNRVVNRAAVERYYQDMIAGRWVSTHQGILIYENGILSDAQHRLVAIIEADHSAWMLVTRAWKRDDIHHAIDGGAMRKPGFRADIPDALASVIRAWYYMCGGKASLINDVNLVRAIDSFIDGTIDPCLFTHGCTFVRRATSGAAFMSYMNTEHWNYVNEMYSLLCTDPMKAASVYPVVGAVSSLFRKMSDWPKEGLYLHRNNNESAYYSMLWLLHPDNKDVTNIPTAITPTDPKLAEIVSQSRQLLHRIVRSVFGETERG